MHLTTLGILEHIIDAVLFLSNRTSLEKGGAQPETGKQVTTRTTTDTIGMTTAGLRHAAQMRGG
jgi:hypothetical protein